MMTLQRAGNACGKSRVWPAAIFAYTPGASALTPVTVPGHRAAPGNLPGLAQMRAANAPRARAGPVTFRPKCIYGVRPLWRGPAGNVPVTDECGTLTDRGVLSKSPNRLASSARRLMIEATYPI